MIYILLGLALLWACLWVETFAMFLWWLDLKQAEGYNTSLKKLTLGRIYHDKQQSKPTTT